MDDHGSMDAGVGANSGFLQRRQVARSLSYRFRYRAMSSNDQVTARRYRKLVLILSCLKDEDETMDQMFQIMVIMYLSKVLVDTRDFESIGRPPRVNRSIDSFCVTNCQPMFQFKKPDLTELYELMEWPDMCTFSNGSRMRGEEVFLRGLHELVSGNTKHLICETIFGREYSTQSRAFTYFINFIYDKYAKLVHDNLEWWHKSGYNDQSFFAIEAKIRDNGFPADMRSPYFVAFFIDCNCRPTCRVGGGPAEGGANAARWCESIQRAFYNGWKSIHGMKHQTVDNAYGITVDMFGPTSLRRNDNTLLRLSDINGRLRALQEDELLEDQFHIFGDSAYPTLSHLNTYYKADEHTTVDKRKWNSAMKKVRISIEWNYGYQCTLFKYLEHKKKLKLMESPVVSKIYTVTVLLRNFHTCMYGCQTSNYFNISMPEGSLAHYMNQTYPPAAQVDDNDVPNNI